MIASPCRKCRRSDTQSQVPCITVRRHSEVHTWDNGPMKHLTAGQRIRQAREAAGYNQGEFAKLVGCKRNTLSEIENGESKLPSAVVLHNMCNVLGKTTGWIIYGEDGDLKFPTPEEARTLEALRALTDEQREAVEATLAAFLASRK